MEQVLQNHGAGGRDRTGDLLITSPNQNFDGALTCGKHNTADQAEAHSGAQQNAEPGKDTGKDKTCPCGKPSNGWPGDGDDELCLDCWEAYCSKTWWAAVDTRGLVEPLEPASRWRGVVLTGGVVAGDYGTQTQTPHEQASFADIVGSSAGEGLIFPVVLPIQSGGMPWSSCNPWINPSRPCCLHWPAKSRSLSNRG